MKAKAAEPLPSQVQSMKADGAYRLHKVVIRVHGGKITQIEGLPQKPPISLFMGKKVELLAPIFAYPPVAIYDACTDYPSWWKCLEKGGNKAHARQIIQKLFPTPASPMRWAYSSE